MSLNSKEVKIFGKRAVKAVFENRPNSINKVHLTAELKKEFSSLISFCSKNRIAYKIVLDSDLEKLSASIHHEGIFILTSPQEFPTLNEFISNIKSAKTSKIIFLEDVDNPHNLGAIIRTAAFFGVDGLIIASKTQQLSGSTYRTAEGGAEHVPTIFIKDTEAALKLLQSNNYTIIATSPHAKQSVHKVAIPKKVVLIFGAEGPGLKEATIKNAAINVAIPGSKKIESLNVAQSVTAMLAILADKNI